jgi:hypothetical protein
VPAGCRGRDDIALVLAGEALRKFGGDSLPEVLRNAAAFDASLRDG